MADLTPKEKEVWAGLQRSGGGGGKTSGPIEAIKRKLEQNINWGDYRGVVRGSAIGDYSEHATWLQDNAGLTEDETSSLNNNIQTSLTDEDSSGTTWDEYDEFVGDTGTWDEWLGLFGTGNSFTSDSESEDGNPTAGIRTFDSDGRTYDGVEVPAGAVEVFGREVHFSQRGEPTTENRTSATWTNLQVSDAFPSVGEFVTVSADVENEGGQGTITAYYLENDRIEDTRTVSLGESETRTVSFQRTFEQLNVVEVSISHLPPITINTVHSGIQ